MVVEHVIKQWKEDGKFPEIPKTDYSKCEVLRPKLSLMPEVYSLMDEVIDHFKDTPQRTNRSQIINHCIDILREG